MNIQTDNFNNRKIAIIASLGPPPYLGGIENVVDTLIKSSLKENWTFVVFDLYRIPDINRTKLVKSLYAFRLFFCCFYFMIKENPSIVHFNFCSGVDFWKHSICLVITKIVRKKTIFQLHGGEFEDKYNNYLKPTQVFVKSIFRVPDKILVLSNYWFNFLSSITNGNKISIIGNPIDVDILSLKNEKTHDTKFRLLLLGRVGKHKGHYIVVNALPNIISRFPNVIVSFAGRDDEFGETNRLKLLAEDLSVGEYIEFLGPVVGDDKTRLLQSSYALILPSYGENLPLSILEGIAAELPIIATNVGGIPEILENGKLGYLINPGNSSEFAAAVIELLNTKQEKIKAMTREAVIKLKSKYDKSVIAEKYNEIYTELLI